MKVGNTLIAQSDEQGAWPTLYAATQDIAGDSYVGPNGFRGGPRATRRSSAAAPRRRTRRPRAGCGSSRSSSPGVSFPLVRAAA